MPVETATYISDLDPTNPDGDAQKFEGDNHFILIKGVLQNTLPNANAAITATPAELNYLSGVTSSVLHTSQLAALPGPIGTTTPVAGYFSTLQSNGEDVVVDTRSLTAGSGLTGGGSLAADRTFNVGAGTGIAVDSNNVLLDTANDRNVSHSGVSINVSGGLLSGGGDLTSTRTITLTDETIEDLVGGMVSGNTETNITVTYQDSDGTLDFSVPSASTSTAGVIEMATEAESIAGSSTTRAMSPGNFGTWSIPGSNFGDGYYIFPGGLCIQFGSISVGGNSTSTQTLPRAMQRVFAVNATANSTAVGADDNLAQVSSVGTSQFSLTNGSSNTLTFYWMVIGYET